MSGAQIAWLDAGRRMHLHHGPIDVILTVEGTGRAAGFKRAAALFDDLLTDLVRDLPRLRAARGADPSGPVARAMVRAIAPFAPVFVTPMAAVAGAVADALLAAVLAGPGIVRAHANNGGDVALWMPPGQAMTAAVPGLGVLRVSAPVGGVATSGWRGRSHSLGIADSVTVLARDAATADAAATLIANAVDLPGHPAIRRLPACQIAPDSDLGARLVTTGVGPLDDGETAAALGAGLIRAQDHVARGLILGAVLSLNRDLRIAGAVAFPSPQGKELLDA